MKKMKKLLSVLLAVVLALSCFTVVGSAARANYKTVADLDALNAYSPYGQVTRVDAETRMSIIFDSLDVLLKGANINMGQVVNVLGLKITIDLTSVDRICYSFDSFKSSMSSLTWGAAALIVNLGILEELSFKNWQSGMTRDGTAQLTIVYQLLSLLEANKNVVNSVLTNGIELGIVANFISGLDLSGINNMVKDLPGLIKGMVFGLFERWDDTTAEITTLETNKKGNGKVESTLNTYVNNLFTNDMSITTVKADASGNITSNHSLPGADADARCRYIKEGNTITVKTYVTEKIKEAQEDLGNTYAVGDYYTSAKYVLKEEVYNEVSTGDYVFAQVQITKTGDIDTNDKGEMIYTGENLKYYDLNSPFLPSLKKDIEAGKVSIDLNANSAGSLLYTFIPYVFGEMVPVVANGSLKKILASWFGARFDYVGEVGDAKVTALPDSSNTFFTQKQGAYLWEWSDYAVINGAHYYRFEDQIYKADLSNTNPYFDVINWDYDITADFLNEYIPSSADGLTSTKYGYTTILQHLNKFLIKLANEVLAPDVLAKMTLTDGDNSKLVANIKSAAQAIISISPESIFGSNYQDGYYSLIMDSNNQTVLVGIACMIVDLVMPQMTFPSAASVKANNVTVGAPLAAVLRELATQLLPGNNYDALIYSDYNKKTFVAGKDNNYWLDVILTIGADIGVYYLKNLADMGEDTAAWAGMTAAGYKENKTYKASDLNEINGVKPWEAKIDYIIDWALDTNNLWAWKFANLVDTTGLDIDMASVQDPWAKLDKIFFDLLPLEDVFNFAGRPSSMTRLEYGLRDKFILAIADLNFDKIVGGASADGLINIPGTSILRDADVLTQIVVVVRNLLNALTGQVTYNGEELFSSTLFVGLDEVLNQNNLKSFAVTLLDNLKDAQDNGLLDTALPLVGFFLGWKFDPQEMADPSITFAHNNGWKYINGKSTNLEFRNASGGMLERHRADSTVGRTFDARADMPYNIVISNITCDDSTFATTQTFPVTVAPGAELVIPYTYTSTDDKVVTFTVQYSYTGKDGKALGGEHTKLMYVYKSETVGDDTKTHLYSSEDADKGYTSIYPFQYVIFTKDIYTSVTEYSATINYKGTTLSNPDLGQSMRSSSAKAVSGQAATYFRHMTNAELKANGWSNTLTKSIGSAAGPLYKALDGVTKETVFPEGQYDMGAISIEYFRKTYKEEGDPKVFDPDFYLYDDFNVGEVYNANIKSILLPNCVDTGNSAAVDAYNAYVAALKQIVIDATMPKLAASYVTTCHDFEAHIATFKTALSDLQKYMAKTGASASADADALEEILVNAMKTAEPGEYSVNFQDYYLYEYFIYHDYRQEVWNRMGEYKGPVAPTNTLWTMDGTGITDNATDKDGNPYAELTNKVYGSATGKRLLGLKAATWVPTAEDMANYNMAVDSWNAPGYTEMSNLDLASRVLWAQNFLQAKAANKQFLNREIEAAAKNYGTTATSDKYSTETWAAYYDAYTEAVKVNADANARQSEVFAAKWALMVAEKNLIEAAKSVKDNAETYLKELNAVAAQADVIFDNPTYYVAKTGIAEAAKFDGTDEEYAYAQLIKARGYEYVNQYGDNVILFDNCAIEYLTYDRENTTSNLKRIDASVDALKKAIDLFECAIKLEANDGDKTTTVAQEIKVINGITPGSIASMADLLTHVKATAAEAKLVPFASNANAFGTGAYVNVDVDGLGTLTTYWVVIYGDVNGDGAIDAFDAIELDVGQSSDFTGAYKEAIDVNGDGIYGDSADYSMIVSASATSAVINQIK